MQPAVNGTFVSATAVLAMTVCASSTPVLQEIDVAIRLVSPEAGAYVSGPMLIRAVIEPAARSGEVTRVRFFANGRFVCQLESAPFECAWDAGTTVTEHVVQVSAELRDGRRLTHEIRTKDAGYVERVDVQAVHLVVTVTETNGRFVRGLQQEAFRVLEDGMPQTVTNFATENIPLELVAAVDVSQSMRDAMPTLKRAVLKFLSALRDTDSVSLAAFNDGFFPLLRPQASPEQRERAVGRLAAWGGTALYDAIAKSLALLAGRQGRRAVVVFSDGQDESSKLTLQAVRRRVEENQGVVYVIAQGRALQVTDARGILTDLATLSGGKALFPSDVEELDETFQQILDELSHQYLLTYQPTHASNEGKWRTIRVELPGLPYQVRTRTGYRETNSR